MGGDRRDRPELGEQGRQNALIARIRAEYEELPGLRLTLAQARRLWQIDHATCAALFEQLVADGFLQRSVTRQDASVSYAVR